MNNPLAQLKDIHTPDSISQWPPAYGWWLLTLVIIGLAVWLTLVLIKYHKRNLAKRQAINELNALSIDSIGWRLTLNSLLKRLIMSYHPTLHLQQLYGDDFTCLLTEALPLKQQTHFQQQMSEFQKSLYQSQANSVDDFNVNKNLVISWIKASKLDNKKVKQRINHWCEQYYIKQQGVNHV